MELYTVKTRLSRFFNLFQYRLILFDSESFSSLDFRYSRFYLEEYNKPIKIRFTFKNIIFSLCLFITLFIVTGLYFIFIFYFYDYYPFTVSFYVENHPMDWIEWITLVTK
jgi:hypothetical protein